MQKQLPRLCPGEEGCLDTSYYHPASLSLPPELGVQCVPPLPLQMLTDLNTYLHKAIPDTRLTIKKYLDVKFEYLVRTWAGAGIAGYGLWDLVALQLCHV